LGGSAVGFALSLPIESSHHYISILWPPIAVLVSLMLVVPVRRWGVVILSAMCAHGVAQSFQGTALWLMGMQFTHNCLIAVLGSLAMKRIFGDAPFVFRTFRSALIFLVVVAGIVAPVAAIFPATVRGWPLLSAEFWWFWRRIGMSSALAVAIFTPVVSMFCAGLLGYAGVGRPTWRQVAEFVVLLALLAISGWSVFFGPLAAHSTNIPAMFYLPLPLLIWAALRFGPEGSSVALALCSVMCVCGVLAGSGPFGGASIEERAVSAQLFLLALCVPMLCLGAVAREHSIGIPLARRSKVRLGTERSDDLAGRLIEVQEIERARIARELHDDVNQQLAALSIAIGKLKRGMASNEVVRQELESMQKRAIHLTDEVRNICRGLHSGVLQHVGLSAAVRAYCNEVQENHELTVKVSAEADTEATPENVALCLYRILQEAIQNVVRHAEAKVVDVRLVVEDGGLELTVTDDGKGFDVSGLGGNRGLGLMSMDERMRMVHGRLAINSEPLKGTTLRAWAPAP
jgi:two-component system sensor histidine kinase UhpB